MRKRLFYHSQKSKSIAEHRRTQTMHTAAFFELFETIYDLTWLFLLYL